MVEIFIIHAPEPDLNNRKTEAGDQKSNYSTGAVGEEITIAGVLKFHIP